MTRPRISRLLADRLVAGALAVALVVQVLVLHRRGPLAVEIAFALLLSLPLAERRRRPLAALAAVGVAGVVKEAALVPTTDGIQGILVVVIAMYSVGRERATPEARAGLGLGLAIVLAVSVIQSGTTDVVFPPIVFGLAPWLVGRIIRSRTLLARELAERELRLVHAGEEAERRAVAEERRRLARELHDVVAHSLSVMVVQAGAGRRMAERDPERARECAVHIERVGRETMGELRRLLGVLGDGGADRSPAPALGRLGELAERARAAGLPVELRVSGEPPELPAGLELAAFRIVQEALTNTLKHAGPARARVLVNFAPGAVELVVADDGRGAAGGLGGGHGLVGMRERAAVYGGDVVAGRGPDGGWEVHARLPVPAPAVVGA